MASPTSAAQEIEYPVSDGKPMGETEIHRDNLMNLVIMLKHWYSDQPNVCVSGNMFVYYVEGNPRRHVSPDVFVTHGVPKQVRECYKCWEEGKTLDLVIELTSRTTQNEDEKVKYKLYEQVLKVPEYILFDPKGEYLTPQLRGYRLLGGRYTPIAMVDGRIPSEVVRLHLEASGSDLRLFDPATRSWLPSPDEIRQQALDAMLVVADVKRELEVLRRESADAMSGTDEARRSFEAATREAQERVRKAEEALRDFEARQRDLEEEMRRADERQRQSDAEIQRLRRLLGEYERDEQQ